MGIERATTRWYLQRLAYESEAASLEAKLGEMRNNERGLESKERAEFEKQLAQALAALHRLGPCPKAMMG
jgi:septal ring factor EnvC (AmiA/AmiB activator)